MQSTRNLLRLRSLAVWAVLFGSAAHGATIVPGGYANVEGGSNAISPLSVGSGFFGSTITGRWQQLYASSQFASITPGQSVTSVAFRDPSSNSPLASTSILDNIEVYLTKTSTAINGLSATYANNNNATTTLVYSGSITFSRPFNNTIPRNFGYVINLQTPFAYDPADGNLMLDIIVKQGNNPNVSSLPTLDYARGTAPSMSAVLHYSSSLNGWGDASGTAVTNSGWITQFNFDTAVPEPASIGLCCGSLALFAVGAWRKRNS